MTENLREQLPTAMSAHNTKNKSTKNMRRTGQSLLLKGQPLPAIKLAVVAFLLCLLPTGLLAAAEQHSVTTSPASAATSKPTQTARWFQVELILFSQEGDTPLDAEQWPDLQGVSLPDKLLELSLPPTEVPPVESAVESVNGTAPKKVLTPAEPAGIIPSADVEPPIIDAPAMPTAYQFLGDDQLQLTEMVEKLRRSRNFHPLLHVAWQQPTEDREHSQPIFFMEGMDDPLPPAEATDTTTPEDAQAADENLTPTSPLQPPMLEEATEEDTKIGPPNPRFVGTITLSVERYLHLATDLIYRQPVTQHLAVPISDLELWYDRPYLALKEPQGPAYRLESWQAMRGFQFKESRRMRSTEIHYLDNPFMGLVVMITPVELPEPAEAIEQTSPQNILQTPTSPTQGKVRR